MRVGFGFLLAHVLHAAAVRRDLTGADAAVDVMRESLSTAGFAMDTMKNLQASKVTPAVSQLLEGIRQELLGKVRNAIIQDHKDAQESIQRKVGAVKILTAAVSVAKAKAYLTHKLWGACVGSAQTLLKEHEALKEKWGREVKDQTAKCLEEKNSRPFQAQTQKFDFSCDMAASKNCLAELAALKTKKDDELSKLDVAVGAARNLHTAAKKRCDDATDLALTTDRAAAQKSKDYTSKMNTCVQLDGASNLAICKLGDALGKKCTSVVDYRARVADIKKAGGSEWSDPDRRVEWKSSQSTACMLNAFLNSGDYKLTTDATTKCQNSLDFGRDVGNMDYQEGSVGEMLTEKQFTCQEKTVTFGPDWVLPSSSAPRSTEFQKQAEKTVQVDLGGKSNPFSICT